MQQQQSNKERSREEEGQWHLQRMRELWLEALSMRLPSL
jgi:hypothetical protein